MEHLTKLFKLLELTRSQPQTGYALSGISQGDLSNLAEHHYLTAVIAWQLARTVNQAGASLNIERVLEFALVHDLGELFGGDIAMPYAKINRRAYRAAKVFEAENQKFLARFFGKDANYFKKLGVEILKPGSDEAIVAKLADYLECSHYKFYARSLKTGDGDLVFEKSARYLKKIKDKAARRALSDFLKIWIKDLPKDLNLYDGR